MEKDNQLKKSNREIGPDEIWPYLLNSQLSMDEIVKLIELMKKRFTTDRDEIDRYVEEIDFVSAYSIFYLPTNMAKWDFLLRFFPKETIHDLSKRPFFDIGAGPGTFSLAMLSSLQYKINPTQCILIEKSDLMRAQAKNILQNFFPEIKIDYLKKLPIDLPKDEGVMVFGHSINEMSDDVFWHYISVVRAKYVFWFEPAIQEHFSRYKKLRAGMIESGYDIIYPCPSMAACPSDWCHQVVRKTWDEGLERLSQLASLNRRTMPVHIMAFERSRKEKEKEKEEEMKPLNSWGTVTQFLGESKFAFNYEICLRERENEFHQLIKFEVQKKSMTKDEMDQLRDGQVGDQWEFEIVKKITDKFWRTKIIRYREM